MSIAIRCFFPLCRSRSGKGGIRTAPAGAKRHGEADVAAASRILEEGGVVRVRIVMTKGELRRLMAAAGLPPGPASELQLRRRLSARRVAPESLDELRAALGSWRLRKGAAGRRAQLETIPEEAMPADQLGYS